MNRRRFLLVAPALAIPVLAAAAVVTPIRRRVDLTVRLLDPPAGQPRHMARLVDVTTGADVSRQFPRACCGRLYRARASGRPIRLALFALDAHGRHFIEGADVAKVSAWVQVQ